MSIIRDMRERIDALEERECQCSASRWADAAPWIAMWAAFACVMAAIALAEPAANPSVECVKAGGEWSWGLCRRVKPQ
jgi:hypothetical protein